jgi:hypothetical protein
VPSRFVSAAPNRRLPRTAFALLQSTQQQPSVTVAPAVPLASEQEAQLTEVLRRLKQSKGEAGTVRHRHAHHGE